MNELHYEKEGKSLGVKITSNGYYKQVLGRKNQGEQVLKKLGRFLDNNIGQNKNTVKAIVIPTEDRSSIPLPRHTLSNTQLRKLQRAQTEQLHRDTHAHNTRQIHELTNTEPLNVRLYKHRQAIQVKETLRQHENERHEPYRKLTTSSGTAFSSPVHSLAKIETPPDPIYT